MKTTKSGSTTFMSHLFRFQLLIFLGLALTACGATSQAKEGDMAEDSAATTEASESMSTSSESAAATSDAGDAVIQVAEADTGSQAASMQNGSSEQIDNIPEMTKPPRIVQECQKEGYVKQEKQSRASIKKGRAATKEGRYGVGFRDGDEYKKWSNMHNLLFAEVSKACEKLSDCAKKNSKGKDKACATEAASYDEWQKTVKSFTEKVKTVEHVQPPKLCSSPPSPDDLPRCYEELADKIDKVCGEDDEECTAVSACWRSVSFLDVAINQAESACRFAHTKLSKCRAYTTSTGRRKAKFKQCGDLQKEAGIDVVPVL